MFSTYEDTRGTLVLYIWKYINVQEEHVFYIYIWTVRGTHVLYNMNIQEEHTFSTYEHQEEHMFSIYEQVGGTYEHARGTHVLYIWTCQGKHMFSTYEHTEGTYVLYI